jgi:subtilisin family serine protease
MRSRVLGFLVLIPTCAVLAGLGTSGVGAKGSKPGPRKKLDRFLQNLADNGAPGERVRVIVTAQPGARQHVKAGLAASDGAILNEHSIIEAVTAEVPVGRLRALGANDDVRAVSVDAEVRAGATDNVGTFADNTLLPTLGLQNSTEVGNDVGVAVIDSGIVNHEQLPVAAFYDFLKGAAAAKRYDDFGHGTHVAGMIRNKDDKGDARYRSVARGARLIVLKVLGNDGAGLTSSPSPTGRSSGSMSSTFRSDIRFTSPRPPIPSCRRSSARWPPASSWSRRPAMRA